MRKNADTSAMLVTVLPILDDLLQAHAPELGPDAVAYRNHTYRVVNFCAALSRANAHQLDKIGVAAAFHDLGIWTDHTFDYLEPSERLARARLAATGHAAWTAEISEMILQHHKLSRYRAHDDWLVEPFRRADWIDVSLGALTFGLAREQVREIRTAFPNEGFHKRLVQLGTERLRSHPLSPLPMMRL